MSAQRLDAMIEIGTRIICDPLQPLEDLPSRLAADWPDAPALELTVALAAAADAVQSVFGEKGESGQRAVQVWRQAAIVAADVHYLTEGTPPVTTAGNLLAYWARNVSESVDE